MRPWAEMKETHAGVVLLLGDRAYKLKKPVDLGFLDFTRRETRRRVCREEVELNRRLAPDVYEGVADVLGPDGRPCEHLVVMRRMPEERRLSTLIRSGEPVDDHLRLVARTLASMHSRARRGPEVDEQGGAAALRSRWTASFDQVRGLPDPVLAPEVAAGIERLTLRFLDGRGPLLAARVAEGRIVDGHGDLMAEDVFCLDDGPRILDCLEFDERLRFLDGLDDAAFLAMDLERLGVPRQAERFLHWYAEFSGDPAPPSLWHHYVAYRAFVRAKVACLRHGQGADAAASEARELAALALRHLRAGAVRLVLVGGPPGSGKSTLAAALADRLGYTLLSSDRVRKELAGLAPTQAARAAFGEGIDVRRAAGAGPDAARPRRAGHRGRVVDRRRGPGRRGAGRGRDRERPGRPALLGATGGHGRTSGRARRRDLGRRPGRRRGHGRRGGPVAEGRGDRHRGSRRACA